MFSISERLLKILPDNLVDTCLSYCYVAVTKHSSRSNLREKGFTLASPFKEIVCHVTEAMAAGRDIMVAGVRG